MRIHQGQEAGLAIKPSPEGVFRILEKMNADGAQIKPENVIYLGDTNTDVKTGRGAGAYTVGALWGFREREELVDGGADTLAAHPMDVAKLLNV